MGEIEGGGLFFLLLPISTFAVATWVGHATSADGDEAYRCELLRGSAEAGERSHSAADVAGARKPIKSAVHFFLLFFFFLSLL